MTIGIRDVRLGRLKIVTTFDAIKESFGDGFEVSGPAIVPGERKPRPLDLALPIRGAKDDTDPIAEGERLRRQVRSLLDNSTATSNGLYLAFDLDAFRDGWLLIGGGDLEDGDNGGSTFADYKLTLTDVYRIAAERTHRRGRRLDLPDLRISTTARDYRGTIFSTDFAAQPLVKRLALPVGATDLVRLRHVPWAFEQTRAGIRGGIPIMRDDTLVDLERVSFEEVQSGAGDVLILDRQGITAPAYTEAAEADPQLNYGWEEVYGPNHPLTAGDVPVLDNGLCRLRYNGTAGPSFAYDTYVAGSGYVEQARVIAYRRPNADPESRFDTLLSTDVVEWTPERAIIHVVLGRAGASDRAELYLTLEQGATGPRIESYVTWATGGPLQAVLRVIPATAGTVTFGKAEGTSTVTNGTSVTASAEPWGYLLPPSPALPIHLAILQVAAFYVGRADTTFYGSTRNGVSVVGPNTASNGGYLSVRLGSGTRAAVTTDARELGREGLAGLTSTPNLVRR